jgi:hypothetical protein
MKKDEPSGKTSLPFIVPEPVALEPSFTLKTYGCRVIIEAVGLPPEEMVVHSDNMKLLIASAYRRLREDFERACYGIRDTRHL